MMYMNKSKIAVAVLSLAAVLSVPQAMAGFGLGNLVGGTSNGAAADPDAFIKSAQDAENLMNNSVALISRAVLSKEKVAELDAKKKAASAETDAGEKKAKNLAVQKSRIAATNEAMGNADFEQRIKKMDASQKAELGAAAYNFMLALLQDKALVEQSSSLVSSLSSNPMNLSKVGGVKDVTSSLSNQISAASEVAGKMPKIFSAVGVTAPASKEEKPKKVAQVDVE
jgi:hypothetical protein